MLSLGFTQAVRSRLWRTAYSYQSTAVRNASVLSFKDLSFAYKENELLQNVDFSVDAGSKVTIMGQNGSGKSTIMKLLSKTLPPDEGRIIIKPGETVACAMQTMPLTSREMTVKEFFSDQLGEEHCKHLKTHEIDAKMAKVLKSVGLSVEAPADRIIKSFSGGQQARLLLAAALIQKPSILLLDEPTNNLDADGLWNLQTLIQETDKTCVVISHDEDFLNSFTDQVLYLDMFSKKVETYLGDYFFVKQEIKKRIQKENAKNALLQKKVQQKKDQANKFANKGGGMRKVAKTMRGAAEEMEASVVDVRKEDNALRDFTVPFRSTTHGKLLQINQVSAYERSAPIDSVELRKGSRVQVCGPNGIGKTTFLEMIVAGTAPGVTVGEDVQIGYYRQDFHNFDFNSTVLACLEEAAHAHDEQEIRKTAAGFFLGNRIVKQKVGTLSEGQKGLLSLACLCLRQPSILVMDEPTNHINFRHIPALAQAVGNFQGAVLLVSHDYHFVETVGVDSQIDMGEVFCLNQ